MNDKNKKVTTADLVQWHQELIEQNERIAKATKNESDPGLFCWAWVVVGGFVFLLCLINGKTEEFSCFCLFLIVFTQIAKWKTKAPIVRETKPGKNWYD